ncbi:MAG TPA: hypothetical protein VFO60_06215 [Candidatus Dormibacteraeota bacterium]|nr:hypothetical protein [Candidatus Dormibacteraeota bacterium]
MRRIKNLGAVAVCAAVVGVWLTQGLGSVSIVTASSTKSTPNPSQAQLRGVSCVSASFCEAVGVYRNNGSGFYVTLAEMWNGKAWALQSPPSPAGSSATYLNSVSCISASLCEAVGNADTGAVAEVWNGSNWALQPTPNPGGLPGSDFGLSGVSCVSSDYCEAVGFTTLKGDYAELTEVWNGTAWALQTAPSNAVASLLGVSCISAKSCEAVGTVEFSGGGSIAAAWDGTSWTAQSAPTPAGAFKSTLYAVSCGSASFCEAAGNLQTSATSLGVTLSEVWDGTSWTMQPGPTGATGVLKGVSCVSSSYCEAVGYAPAPTKNTVAIAFVQVWNGSSWAVQSAPDPGSGGVNELLSASCLSATDCEASGYYTVSSGKDQDLKEGWDGAAWALQQ